MKKKHVLLALSVLSLASLTTFEVTPVQYEHNVANVDIARRNASSSSSSSSDFASGVYGSDTTNYDASKVNVIGSRLETYVKPGDIFVDTVGATIKVGWISYQTGHTGIVKSVTYDSDGKCVIKTIEALGYDDGIQEVELTAQRVYNGAIYRVEGVTEEQIDKAIYFSEQQVGKSYSFKPFKRETAITTSSWYCSELVVASYKYAANIDLASTDSFAWINPTAIGDDSKTKKVVANEVDKPTTVSDLTSTTHKISCDGDTIVDDHIDDKVDGTCRICGHSC